MRGNQIALSMSMPNRSFLAVLSFLLIFTLSCNPVLKYINSDDVLSWEGDIRVLDSLNAVEVSDENTLLVTGSSSVRLWDSIHADLDPYLVMQRGYGGAKLSDYNHYARRIIKPQQFKAILVFVANDISGNGNDRTPREVLHLFKNLVGQIRINNPGTPVFWIETTPTPSRWHVIGQIREANALIRSYCEKNEDLHFIPTYDVYVNQEGMADSAFFRKDMLHLNREGYLRWTERIKQTLEEEAILP